MQWQKVSDFLIGGGVLHVHPAGAAALRHLRRPRAAAVGAPPVRSLHRALRPRPPRRHLHLRPPGLAPPPAGHHRRQGAGRRRRVRRRRLPPHVSCGCHGGASLAPDVLRTAVFHLSDALGLHSCAVWMPAAAAAASDGGPSLLHLVHRLPEDDHQDPTTRLAICSTDPDVAAVMASKNAKELRPGSALRRSTSTSGHGHAGAAAIRMPMLRVSNFVDASSSLSDGQGAGVSYAIMVLVLPAPAPTTKNHRTRGPRGGGGAREWSRQELEIVEVAADQLAVALSHAAVLKEWQLTRHKLAERQRVLVQARHDAAVATRARDASQSAMRDGVLRPMHPVAGLLSLMQAQQQEDEAFRCAEQRVAVDAMARISALSSTLTDDVMAALLTPTAAGVSLARRPFDPRALVKDAAGVAGCLARCRGLGFSHRAEMSSLPAGCWVVGDDRRVFHLLLHMVGVLLGQCECHCHDLCFAVDTVPVDDQETMSGSGLPDWITPNFSGCNTVCVRFRFGITRHFRDGLLLSSSPRPQERITRRSSVSISSASSKTRLCIATCNKIVQVSSVCLYVRTYETMFALCM